MATCCVETTSFCLFCICLLSIFFGGLSSSWSRTHSEQSILTHCLCDSWIVLTFVIYLTPLFIFPDWRVLIQKFSLKSLHLIISYSELILHFFVMLFFFFPSDFYDLYTHCSILVPCFQDLKVMHISENLCFYLWKP